MDGITGGGEDSFLGLREGDELERGLPDGGLSGGGDCGVSAESGGVLESTSGLGARDDLRGAGELGVAARDLEILPLARMGGGVEEGVLLFFVEFEADSRCSALLLRLIGGVGVMGGVASLRIEPELRFVLFADFGTTSPRSVIIFLSKVTSSLGKVRVPFFRS